MPTQNEQTINQLRKEVGEKIDDLISEMSAIYGVDALMVSAMAYNAITKRLDKRM